MFQLCEVKPEKMELNEMFNIFYSYGVYIEVVSVK
jgi:hypothetical protein